LISIESWSLVFLKLILCICLILQPGSKIIYLWLNIGNFFFCYPSLVHFNILQSTFISYQCIICLFHDLTSENFSLFESIVFVEISGKILSSILVDGVILVCSIFIQPVFHFCKLFKIGFSFIFLDKWPVFFFS